MEKFVSGTVSISGIGDCGQQQITVEIDHPVKSGTEVVVISKDEYTNRQKKIDKLVEALRFYERNEGGKRIPAGYRDGGFQEGRFEHDHGKVARQTLKELGLE